MCGRVYVHVHLREREQGDYVHMCEREREREIKPSFAQHVFSTDLRLSPQPLDCKCLKRPSLGQKPRALVKARA